MRRREGERGSSLIEVVMALGILLILMIGILQMFSMAYLTNLNAAASTEMAYKGQQTAEVLRWALYQKAVGQPIGVSPYSLPSTALDASATPYALPRTSGGQNWNFWGPSGMGVIERQNPPYNVVYTVADGGTTWDVTVQVTPWQSSTNAYSYIGVAKKGKVVTYVVQAPKAAP